MCEVFRERIAYFGKKRYAKPYEVHVSSVKTEDSLMKITLSFFFKIILTDTAIYFKRRI